MLSANNQKAELSVAYLIAIAAQNGFACEITQHDFDSIDATISFKGKLSDTSIYDSPDIGVQLKSTSKLQETENLSFKFAIPIKNYKDLKANTLKPRILVVLKLPKRKDKILSHSEKELSIRNCAYWLNLFGKPDINNKDNVTVYIPKKNILSPETLYNLMLKASKQEKL